MAAETVDQVRESLGTHDDFEFVAPEEFCELLVSRERLLRADQRHGRLRGLLNPGTGARFVVEHERLSALRDHLRDG